MSPIDKYAVYGHPIKHSQSPRIHQLFAKQTGQSIEYNAFDITRDEFTVSAKAFFSSKGGGKGLNCTLPLKEIAFAFADKTTVRAQFSKAVNTLARLPDGSILGDNTDGCGLINDLIGNQGVCLGNKKILVLGAGGAARGILSPLFEQNPSKIVIANRTVDKAIDMANEFANLGYIEGCGYDQLNNAQYDLVINATSASLSGELPPLPDTLLSESACCYDLAYSDKPTTFIRWAKEHHADKCLDGLGMLVEQAAEAFYLWRGIRPKTAPVLKLLNSEREI